MTTPTTQPLKIELGGVDITDNVDVNSVRINDHNRQVSEAEFTIENGGALTIVNWVTVSIFSDDEATVYFEGYITDVTSKTRGLNLDYRVSCQGREVRLQKAMVDGAYSGSDIAIIRSLFTQAEPELLSLFEIDFLTDPVLPDMNIEFNNETLFEALERIAHRSGADWGFEAITEIERWNYARNPSTELSVAGWDWVGSEEGTWSRYGVDSHVGSYSMRLEGSAGGTWLRYGAVDGYELPVVPGYAHEISNFIKNNGTPSGLNFRRVVDPDDNVLNQLSIPFSSYTNWTEQTWQISAAVTASWDFDRIYLMFAANQITHDYLIDALRWSIINLAGSYFDGDTANATWLGTAHDSISYIAGSETDTKLLYSDIPEQAPFDICDSPDFSSCFPAIDLEIDFPAFDGINVCWVVGGFGYADKDFEYPADGQTTHFDFEERFYPRSGQDNIQIWKNTGTDRTPSWSAQTVGVRGEDTLGDGNDLLWEKENHWVEFSTAPSDLTRAWKIEHRALERTVVKVRDELAITDQGVELTDTVYDDTITSDEAAADRGWAEIARRSQTAKVHRFTTNEPGLRAGQEIDITNDLHGLTSEPLIIQSVRTRYLRNSPYVEARVEAGTKQPDLADLFASTHRQAEGKPSVGAVAIATTVYAVDHSSELVTHHGAIVFAYTS